MEEDGGYRVTKALREQVVFARQNVVSDPPFSRMNLVTCRNLLIYLEPGLQKKIFPAFHYALKPGGFLFLGASESIGQFTDLFAPADKKQKIFARKAAPTPAFRLPLPGRVAPAPARAGGGALADADFSPGRGSVSAGAPKPARGARALPARRIAALERELAETRDYLLSVQEQNEAATEELQASGEEVQSANEELQSINEELETSKEELESSNEELTTINDEMVSRNNELNQLSADLGNLQTSIQTAVLLLARDLTVRRFTPAAEKLFNLRATDLGRGFGSLRHNLVAPGFEALLAEVIDTVSIREREVQDKAGRWFALRARPYLTLDNKIDGVVLVLSDIDVLKRSEQEIKVARDFAEATVRHMPVPFLILRPDLRVESASQIFYQRFQVAPDSTEGRLIYELGNGQWDIPALRTLLEKVLPQKLGFDGYEVTHDFADLGRRTMLLSGRRLDNAAGLPERIVLTIEDITKRVQAEGAVHTSEENYRLLVEGATGFAIIRLDFGGRVNMWNVGAARIFGYEEAEILGEHFSRFFTPEQIADGKPERELAEASTKEKSDDDNELVRKDGTRFWANGATTALRDEAGQLTGYAKIVRDVSDHRRAHETLRASESLKSAILDGALDAIITMDHEGKVVDFNPAAERTFGFRKEDMVGQTMVEKIIPERLRGAHRAGLARYLKTGETRVLGQRIEVPARHGDGHEFSIELSINRIPGSEPAMFAATLRDITTRLAAEAALRASEERFRVAVRAVSNIVWTNNPQGEMEGEQPGWAHFTGQTLAEYEGFGWAAAVHPDDAQPTIDAWKLAVAGKRKFEFEHRVRRHDGVWRRCSIRALPTLGLGGEIREWVGVHTDVTDERAAADALLAAKEQAEAASRAKDDFLAALSHELRTPLTPVLMTASALESDPALPAEIRDQLSMMRRNIQLEARLIDDLLDLTRISRGKLTIAPVAADLHQLIQHTAEIVRSDGLGKQVRIVFILEAARHHALADPTRIQQVFWNLIKNALKFTPTGGTITVSTHNDAEGWIVVTVEDTGVGISAEALPHIFKAFEQGDVAGQHRYGGLGLGLAISQAIMGAHGGIIRVASEGPGRGATFTAALPSVDAPAAAAPGTAAHPAPGRKLRLLIVEDHEATRIVLTRLLTLGGHEITATGTIAEALAAFAAAHFDAVISDLGLPDGSGLDLMRQIQRQRPVPGIALSGYGMEDDLRQTKEAGFFAHLVKPVSVDQLRQLLNQLTA